MSPDTCPECGSWSIDPHCGSPTCDLQRCRRCEHFGRPGTIGWIPSDPRSKDKP